MLTRRSWLVYGALAALWLALIGWQAVEHYRAKRSARAVLINYAKNTSGAIAMAVTQRSFFGVINSNRLEYHYLETFHDASTSSSRAFVLNSRLASTLP